MPTKEEQVASQVKELTGALTAAGLKFAHAPTKPAAEDVEVTNAHGHVYAVRVLAGTFVVSPKSDQPVPLEPCATVVEVLAEVQRDKPRGPLVPAGMN